MKAVSAAFALAGLILRANAHLFMNSPKPIEGTGVKTPLEASGSNFPCHGVTLPSSGGQSMPVGSEQTLAFDLGAGANTAVHGGGSCQISITYETDPAKLKLPSSWKVIYSIMGGCPSNTHQNLDGSYTGPMGAYSGAISCSDPKSNGVDCVNSFNFTIPQGMKSGDATLAWTWFNSVGNREFYMNCAAISIPKGVSDTSSFEALPDMFVANLASVDKCPTTASVDVQFPNPGKYATTKKPSGMAAQTALTFPMAIPTGEGCAGDGGSAAATGAIPSSALASPSAYASSVVSAIAPSNTGGSGYTSGASAVGAQVTTTTFATVTSYSSAAVPAYVTASSPLAASSPAPSPSSNSNTSTPSGSCPSGKVPCPSLGSVVCVGTGHFGICDVDGCAVAQVLADGTTCSNGVVTRKRSLRYRRHVRAPHRNGF
ncbi:hypothetical protein LTR66_014857 [Elasticomyces elasticus]|nr:hypothetical protein LTR66_014857 [Elasticomyces elasticus]KAK5007895.1 hypothetical protein LTR28_004697 [Elasticomyces elasticus]